MVDHELLTAMLSELARCLAHGFAIDDVLDDLARRVTTVLEVDAAAVSLRDGHGAGDAPLLRLAAALDERTAELERVQEADQVGPCIDAFRSRAPVTVADLTDGPDHWGTYLHLAREAGIRSVASIPLNTDDDCIGALALYASAPRIWSDDALRAAAVLGGVATSYVVHASELDHQRRTNEQLEAALDSRIIVEQAKGILSAELRISVDEAFEVLRRHARNHNADLRSVADAVVNLGLRPS